MEAKVHFKHSGICGLCEWDIWWVNRSSKPHQRKKKTTQPRDNINIGWIFLDEHIKDSFLIKIRQLLAQLMTDWALLIIWTRALFLSLLVSVVITPGCLPESGKSLKTENRTKLHSHKQKSPSPQEEREASWASPQIKTSLWENGKWNIGSPNWPCFSLFVLNSYPLTNKHRPREVWSTSAYVYIFFYFIDDLVFCVGKFWISGRARFNPQLNIGPFTQLRTVLRQMS